MAAAYDRWAVIPSERNNQSSWSAGVCLLLAAGCAGGAASDSGGAQGSHPSHATSEALERLRARFEEQDQRVQELESRLSLLEAEARQIRDRLDGTHRKPNHVVRIGGSRGQGEGDSRREAVTEGRDRSGSRPTLRLRGEPKRSRASRSKPFVPPEPPPGVSDRLPVSASVKAASGAELSADVAERSGSGHAAVGAYRKALRLLQRGEFDAALEALAAFVVRHPDHRLADDATYWRGEAYYAKRAYEPALRQFEGVVATSPKSDKAARALYKIVLCHRRLGQKDEARKALRRLRRRFPDSDAAAAAAREDAS